MSENRAPIDWPSVPDGALLLVDSAPFVYYLEDDTRYARRFAGLFEAAAQGRVIVALTTVAVAGILTGPWSHGRDAMALQIETALTEYVIVPLNLSVAAQAARLRARYRLRLPDAVQLASALEIGAWALVTHDRDFRNVQDVRILS